MFSLNAIIDNLLETKKKSDENGRHCHYYRLTDKIGLKTYTDEYNFQTAYEWQKTLFINGMAPETYGDFVHISPEGETIYCFLTEHCESCKNFDGNYHELRLKCKKLQLAGTYIGVLIQDTCDFNVGYDKNGNFIMLDTGDVEELNEDSVTHYQDLFNKAIVYHQERC